MQDPELLIGRLETCPPGQEGWQAFEEACIDILSYLFVPPLSKPKIQVRTHSGLDRRDAVFPNRNFSNGNTWAQILRELNARMIPFEFKNYDRGSVGKDEVNQLRNYLTRAMGRLGVLCSNKPANPSANRMRHRIFNEEGKVIIFVTAEDLKKLTLGKSQGQDSSEFMIDLIEWFYLDHE